MPSLCTVNFGCNKPRAPTLTGKIRVKRGGVIAHWSCADVGIDPKKVGLLNSPTIVAKVDTIRLPPRGATCFPGNRSKAGWPSSRLWTGTRLSYRDGRSLGGRLVP